MELKKLLLSTTMGITMCVASAQTLPTISGLVTHLDASTITASNGDAIAQWDDASGLNNHATATGTSQPTYNASSSSFNNKPTLGFDGVDDWMEIANAVTIDNFTVFIIGKYNDTTADHYMLSGYDAGLGGDNRFRVATFSWSDNWIFRAGATNYTGDALQIKDDQTHVFVMNSVSDAWVDDVKAFGDINGSTNTPNIRMGAYQNGTNGFLDGEIAEFILYDKVLTDNEVTSVYSYLQSKYVATAGVEDLANSVNLKVYPNPTANKVTIKANKDFVAGAKLKVYDITGRTMLNKTLQNSSSTLDFSSLPSGSYFVKISNNGKSVIKQISKR